MDGSRFDALLRLFARTPSRRSAVRVLAGSAVGGLLAGQLAATTASKVHAAPARRWALRAEDLFDGIAVGGVVGREQHLRACRGDGLAGVGALMPAQV
jgi:hypothetical protein